MSMKKEKCTWQEAHSAKRGHTSSFCHWSTLIRQCSSNGSTLLVGNGFAQRKRDSLLGEWAKEEKKSGIEHT